MAVMPPRRRQGLDRFVSENHQCGFRSQPLRDRFMPARLADPPDDLFAPEFPQAVGGTAGAILRFTLLAEGSDLGG